MNCVMVDPLPEVMNPLRQQMISSMLWLAVFSQSQFSQQASVRLAAQTFLSQTLAGELAEVTYRTSL